MLITRAPQCVLVGDLGVRCKGPRFDFIYVTARLFVDTLSHLLHQSPFCFSLYCRFLQHGVALYDMNYCH